MADFGSDGTETAVAKIIAEVTETASGQLEKERRKNQLRILGQLRTLISSKLKIMKSASGFFKQENDIFYQRGLIWGRKEQAEKEKMVVVNLLEARKFTVAEIANFAGVTEEFVTKIKNSL